MLITVLYLQHEAKVKTMGITVKEMEAKKRVLEEAVDGLNEEIAKLKATCKFCTRHFPLLPSPFHLFCSPIILSSYPTLFPCYSLLFLHSFCPVVFCVFLASSFLLFPLLVIPLTLPRRSSLVNALYHTYITFSETVVFRVLLADELFVNPIP